MSGPQYNTGQAEREGYDAYRAGRLPKHNPYSYATLRSSWATGYERARGEAQAAERK